MKRLLKHHVLLCLCLVCWGRNATAQSNVTFGFQGGLNFASASLSPSSASTSTRTRFMGGILLEIGVGKVLFVQPELMYVQKGVDITSEGPEAGPWRFDYDYLEVPVLLKVKFDSTGLKPAIFAGPNLALKLKARAEDATTGQPLGIDLDRYTEAFDVALDFGVGVEYEINPRSVLNASIRYSLGLKNINKVDSSRKLRGVQFLVGIKLPRR